MNNERKKEKKEREIFSPQRPQRAQRKKEKKSEEARIGPGRAGRIAANRGGWIKKEKRNTIRFAGTIAADRRGTMKKKMPLRGEGLCEGI